MAHILDCNKRKTIKGKDVVFTVCSDITSRKLINPFVNEGTFIEKTEISTGNVQYIVFLFS